MNYLNLPKTIRVPKSVPTHETKGQKKNRLANEKQEFLMSFFEQEEGFESQEVNGWFLVKSWDGNRKRWAVSIYSPERYENMVTRQKKLI